MEFIYISVIFSSILLAIYLFIRHRFAYWHNREIPFIHPSFPYGNLKGLGEKFSLYEFHREIYEVFKRNHSPFVGLFYYLQPVILCTDLELIKNVFMKDSAHFVDRGAYYNEQDNPISAHLFNLDNPKWKKLRMKLTPTFTSGRIKMMFHTVVDVAERFVRKLNEEEKIAVDGDIDIKEFAGRFTADTIGSVGFGIEINSIDDPNTEFRKKATEIFEKPKYSAIYHQIFLTFKNISRKLHICTISKDIEDFFFAIVRETIEHREKNKISRNDFMDLLIQLKNHGKLEGDSSEIGMLSFNEIAAQCLIFFAAGYETSSNAISHCIFELAQNQKIQEKARDEVKRILAKNDGKLTYEGLAEMNYVEMCLNETLRKYPPVTTLLRYCNKDYKIESMNYTIKKGQLVTIPAYAVHHDPEIYPNPDIFDPERFSQLETAKRPQVAFMPFGHGVRNCIGLRFGVVQAKIGIAMLLNNFKFQPSMRTTYPLEHKKGLPLILLPVDGIHVKISKI